MEDRCGHGASTRQRHSSLLNVTEISLTSGGDVDRRGHRASVKRQVAPVARESRLKIDDPKGPAHLVGQILF